MQKCLQESAPAMERLNALSARLNAISKIQKRERSCGPSSVGKRETSYESILQRAFAVVHEIVTSASRPDPTLLYLGGPVPPEPNAGSLDPTIEEAEVQAKQTKEQKPPKDQVNGSANVDLSDVTEV